MPSHLPPPSCRRWAENDLTETHHDPDASPQNVPPLVSERTAPEGAEGLPTEARTPKGPLEDHPHCTMMSFLILKETETGAEKRGVI